MDIGFFEFIKTNRFITYKFYIYAVCARERQQIGVNMQQSCRIVTLLKTIHINEEIMNIFT